MNLEYNKREVGLRLQLARISNRYTQEDVAEYCGIGKNQISNAECGKVGFSILRIIQICKLYKVSIDYILCGEEFAANTNRPIDNLFEELSSEQQRYAVDIIKIFIEAQQSLIRKSE